MKNSRIKAALGGGLLATALIASSCVSEAPAVTKTFRATSVTVNSSNDDCWLVCIAKDEPKVINIGFRAKVGVPNSASANVVFGTNRWNGLFEQGIGVNQSHNYSGSEQAAVSFANISSPDVLNLTQGTPLEIVGVWAWKVEDDGVLAANANQVANAIAGALKTALNSTVAAGSLPSDPSAIVQMLLDSVWNLGFLNLVGTTFTGLLNNANIASDDVVGSAIYIGVGSTGSLADIINLTAGQVAFPAIALPVVSVPPDIGGGKIFAANGNYTFTDGSTNGGVDGRHTTTYTWN